jgi:hydroxypyruvate isomerase
MKFSACIELLFTEVPFLERIKKAKEFSFDAIEFWDWKEKDLSAIKKECEKNQINVAIFVGNTVGQMVNPKDNDRLIDGVKGSIEKAKYLNCKNLILTTNILQEDRSVVPLNFKISEEEIKNNLLVVLNELKEVAEDSDTILNIEPLNTLVDHKGYFLKYSRDGFNLVKEVNSKNIKVLYDIYHLQIMQGNIISDIEKNFDLIGHFHIADVPGRHEPGTGEINYKNIYKKIRDLGFSGFIGFEYIPLRSTEESLTEVNEIFNF